MLNMNPDRVLEVRSLTKRFARTNTDKRRVLRHHVYESVLGRKLRRKTSCESEFQALNDVSFSLGRGEAVGLLGLNGAGKSTLLKIIDGQLLPDAGEVRVSGHLESMIELSSGLLPTATGFENINRRAGLLGRTGVDREELVEQVAEFSELGDILEAPVSTYSSGMRARLGFGISVFSNPDLLLIDEVLAVGDFRFRQKCLRKINELRERSTFMMVSHSVNDISRFCERVLVLEEGTLLFDGDAQAGIEFYHERYANGNEASASEKPVSRSAPEPAAQETAAAFLQPLFINEELVETIEVSLSEATSNPSSDGGADSVLIVDASFKVNESFGNLNVGVPVWRSDGLLMTAYSSDLDRFEIQPDSDGVVRFKLEMSIGSYNPGDYLVVMAIHEGNEFLSRVYVGDFSVPQKSAGYWGVANLPRSWGAS